MLYFSVHRYDNGAFYPGGQAGGENECGRDKGVGFNINVPWNTFPLYDNEYIAVFKEVLLPIAVEFKPDIVLVSAGFDAADGDPLGKMKISPQGTCVSLMLTIIRICRHDSFTQDACQWQDSLGLGRWLQFRCYCQICLKLCRSLIRYCLGDRLLTS